MAKLRIKENVDFGGTSQPGDDGPGGAFPPKAVLRRADERARPLTSTPRRALEAYELDVIRRTAGVSVLEDPLKISAIIDAMDAIREQTGKILRSGVQIGREMIALLNQLSLDEGQKVVRAGSELFAGWSAGNLTKMIGAARLFDSGWVDKSLLPTSYTVLYQLSQLDRPLLEHAVDRDLIHPDLSRTEVEQLRRTITIAGDSVRMVKQAQTTDASPEITRIDDRLAELRKEIRTLSARRQKLIAGLQRSRPR
jgi:hypothetical protein